MICRPSFVLARHLPRPSWTGTFVGHRSRTCVCETNVFAFALGKPPSLVLSRHASRALHSSAPHRPHTVAALGIKCSARVK
eukprot:2740221-Pleurochrysis_carterae.AAC.1